MEIFNKHNWFPICTLILGLPGETRQDTKESLDLLFSLKDAKWCAIPTLFVPLGDTRLGKKESSKLVELTDLQWEFFLTCWRYNVDFWRGQSVQWKFNLVVPIYYYLLGRKLFGREIKYPLFRFAHLPERWLRHRLYLDSSSSKNPRYEIPDRVEVPERLYRPQMPALEDLQM